MKNKISIQAILQNMPEKQFNYLINISPKLDFIYFTIPKNACSTILVLLRSLLEENISEIKSNVHDRKKSAFLSPSDIGYDKFLDILKDSEVFKFTVVRNPYSRILSAYLDKFIQLPKHNMKSYELFLSQLVTKEQVDKYIQSPNLSFLEFLTFVSYQQPYFMNEHWKPQLMLGMMNFIADNQIYRFENLDNSIDNLIDNLKNRGYDIEKVKKDECTFKPHSTQADQLIKSYYTDKCLDIFNQIYADDIEQLGYTKLLNKAC